MTSSAEPWSGGLPSRLLIVGTGGQGVLTAARLLTAFLVKTGHKVTSGQLHGMAQRGGSVQSSVMVDCGVSPTIPSGGADVILGFEPLEVLRALPFISSGTKILMNSAPVIPYTVGMNVVFGDGRISYPKLSDITDRLHSVTPHLAVFDATHLAQQAGSLKVLYMIMLGCFIGFGLMSIVPEEFLQMVLEGTPSRFFDSNRDAFLRGLQVAEKLGDAGETGR